jgi:PAS domain S-box-containing protein
MNFFRNISIRNKITIISMLTSMIVLLLLLVSFSVLEFTTSRTALVEKIATLAEVIGTNCSAALTFKDQKSAEATLSALSAESDIEAAAIYSKDGRLFALYLRGRMGLDELLPEIQEAGVVPGRQYPSAAGSGETQPSFHANDLELSRNIVIDGEVIGSVCLKSSLAALRQRLKWYSLFALMLLLPSLLVAYLLSSRFQRIISRPIMDLARTMKMVSQEKNYSVQVQKLSEDELGALTDCFNEMLAQIQERDLTLERHREELEREVQRRTAELYRSNQKLERTIEELNLATQFLAQNERRLAYAQQAAHLGYWEWLIALDRLICSGEGYNLFGLEAEEIALNHEAFLDLIHPDDKALVENALETSIATQKSFRVDARINGPDGSLRIVNLQGEVFMDDAGKPVKMTGTIQDITERKEAEKALMASEEKYRALMDNAGDGMVLVDVEGNILEANKKMLELLGYSLDELIGLNFVQIHPSEEMEKIRAAFQDNIASGLGALNNSWILRRDGKKIPVDITGTLVRYAGNTVVQGIFRDISERKKTEEERLLISKLESLGLLAGGIAHDFNNILTAILGNISLARLDAGRGGQLEEPALDRLEEAEKACQRAQALAGQLLSFAKGGLPIKKVTSVANLITESINLALSGSKSRSKLVLPDDLWPMEVDEGQISQVFNNLLINADQAMPEGGNVTVRAENVMVGEELPLPGGRYVKITVSDQGIGIPPNYLGRIFDPYFTTKQKGSGFGLATVHSVIRNNAGYITVESQVGAGTTFYVYVPAVEGESAPVKDIATAPIQGQGRILVMDDEEMVRNVLGRMLQRIGYEVENAINGEEAVRFYAAAQEAGQPFSAVIFDLTIPGGMGGKEALRQILERDPKVKAIVSSGYSDDPIMARFKEYGFKGVITKPYNITELSEVLHEVIIE